MNGRRSTRWFLCALFGLAVSGSAVAAGPGADQTPTPVPGFSDELEVNLVNIDVYVRDHSGRPVTGLSADQFVVREDGVERPITNFSALTEDLIHTILSEPAAIPPVAAETATPSPAMPAAPDIRPTWVVLYIDQENLQPLDRTRVLRRVREFARTSLKPPVQIMVVANEGSLKVKQPFTRDPREVDGALRSLATYSGGWMDRESVRTDLVDRIREMETEQKRTSRGKGDRQLYQEVIAAAREESYSLSQSLGALRQVVEMLAGVDGRKVVVYVSNGLPMTPGLGLLHEYATAFHDNSILTYRGRFEKQAAYQSLTATASAQEIVMDAIDASGLEVTIGGGADSKYGADPTASQVGSSNFQGSMRYLADRTGGIAVVNSNDVSKGLQRIHEDLFAYYSIAFPSSGAAADSVHRVEVTLPGHPDLDVRYRHRFVHKSLETKVQDQVLTGLLVGVDDNTMGVTAERLAATSANSELWTVPVRVSVPMKNLALLPVGDQLVGHVALVAGARDADGERADVQREEHEVSVPADTDIGDRNWTVDSRFLMKAGQHRVVVGILDRVTHKASYVTLNLTVP